MCRSKTAPVWAAATIPDYAVYIESLFEMQLVPNIKKAVSDIQKLQTILPEILASENVYDHIIYALRKVVKGGHVASYQLLIPIYLDHMVSFDNTVTGKIGSGTLKWEDSGYYGHPYKFWKFHEELRDALFDAVKDGYETIAEDMLGHLIKPDFGASAEKIFRYKQGSSRDRILKEVQEWALKNWQMQLFEKVAEYRYFPHEEFQEYLENHVRKGNDKAAKALIDHLMSDKRQDPTSLDMRHHREAALSSALFLAFGRNPYRMVSLILPIYLNLRLTQFDESDTFENDVLDSISKPYWMIIYPSRDEVWDLIKNNKPSSARSALFRRLKLIDSDGENDSICVFGGGANIHVYDDILCYWSRYFRDLDWERVTWRHEVRLGNEVNGDSLMILEGFFHSGMLKKGLGLESLRSLQKAAEFLGIDDLVKLADEAIAAADSEWGLC
ncbi:uncharacterized protein BDV14DRAFT_201328 [Aspergillus stella-maris]|uniref:uncharacterized protein n=1 Tax=Aspergillus stella-maris TaxID=1810926 RepID=UPI003CCD0042